MRGDHSFRSVSLLIALLAVVAVIPEGSRAAEPVVDPFAKSIGTWGQSYPDQWGLQRIGALGLSAPDEKGVIVAVIDSGIDFTHPDLSKDRIWRNPKETLNGIDDDKNGYSDDVIGWNFADGNNNPWDRAGHGTHVAGIIAADTGNGVGISGVASGARIMPLKVLNFIGRGRSSHIAAAIQYAIANGAKIINLSLGGEQLSTLEERAIRQAHAAGILTVIAAGNSGRQLERFPLANVPSVLLVAASDTEDKRATFSNWGKAISLAAPGVDILSLRARDTDLIRFSGAASYRADAAVVAQDYYRASGTSFSAAFVSGVAAQLFARRPTLTATQVARMIKQSARDIEAPGVDDLTGFGLLNAQAALQANPDEFIEARIDAIDLSIRDSMTRVRVIGTGDADQFATARIRAAPERYTQDWVDLTAVLTTPIHDGLLAEFDPRLLRGSRRWVIQLLVTHQNGRSREARFIADLGGAP